MNRRGRIIPKGGEGGGPPPHARRDSVIVDTRGAVLLDGCTVTLVEPRGRHYADGDAASPLLAMQLSGRVNKTEDRSEVLYLFDEDGAAAIVSELVALASRVGPVFRSALMARIDALVAEGATGETDRG